MVSGKLLKILKGVSNDQNTVLIRNEEKLVLTLCKE